LTKVVKLFVYMAFQDYLYRIQIVS